MADLFNADLAIDDEFDNNRVVYTVNEQGEFMDEAVYRLIVKLLDGPYQHAVRAAAEGTPYLEIYQPSEPPQNTELPL